MRRTLAIAAALAAACGSDADDARPVDPVATVSLEEDPAGRSVVATVNGRPVYDDCVARQAAAHELDRRAALEECIDFELLAQEAEARGHASDPDVHDVRTTETARQFLEREFADQFDGPEDVPEQHARMAYEQFKVPEFVRETEWRTTQYARFPVPKTAPRGGLQDLAARLLARATYEQMKNGRWDEEEFLRRAEELGAPHPVEHEEKGAFRFASDAPFEEPYLEATFAIPERGRISPPARTSWGWDIILLVDILPPINQSFEEAEAFIREKIFERSREEIFSQWIKEAVPLRTATINEELLERLARADADRLLFDAPGVGDR